MLTVDIALLKELFSAGQLGGLVWLIWRISHIERMIGNGKPGVFVRKSELDLMKGSADKDHARYDNEIEKLWSAVNEAKP